jgi:hypothetical membrane protein
MATFHNPFRFTEGVKMRNRILLLCGVLAPLVYIVAVVLGGILRPGYSHIAQYVSELIEGGAPNKAILDPLFAIYNILTIAFSIGLFLYVRSLSENRRKKVGMAGALVLAAEGIFGLVTVFFPQDPIGSPATSTGTLHIVLASLSSLTTMLTMLLLGLWFQVIPALHGDGVYSFSSLAVVFLSGGLAASTIANPGPVNGLIERVTIFGFLQWLFVIGVRTYRSEWTSKASPK